MSQWRRELDISTTQKQGRAYGGNEGAIFPLILLTYSDVLIILFWGENGYIF